MFAGAVVSLQQRHSIRPSARENSPVCPLHIISPLLLLSPFSHHLYFFLYENGCCCCWYVFSFGCLLLLQTWTPSIIHRFCHSLLDGPPPFYCLLRNSLKLRSSSLNMYFVLFSTLLQGMRIFLKKNNSDDGQHRIEFLLNLIDFPIFLYIRFLSTQKRLSVFSSNYW